MDEDNTVIEPSPQKRWGAGDTGTNFRPDGRAQAGGFQLGSSVVPAAVIAPTTPIKTWLSNLCFGELVAEVRHLIGNALEAAVVLRSNSDVTSKVSKEELEEFFILSDLTIEQAKEPGATVTKTPYQKCARCWRHREYVGKSKTHPDLCDRCEKVVAAK